MEASLYAASDILYRDKRWEGALSRFEQLEAKAAAPQNVLAAQVGQMRCLKNMERTDDAGKAADKVLKNPDANADLKTGGRAGGRHRRTGPQRTRCGLYQVQGRGQGQPERHGRRGQVQHGLHQAPAEAKYREAETEVFDLAKKFPSYDYWKAKGFILLGDVYVQLDDRFQAKTTLQSVIEHCTYPELVEEARRRLATIEQSEVQQRAPEGQQQPEIPHARWWQQMSAMKKHSLLLSILALSVTTTSAQTEGNTPGGEYYINSVYNPVIGFVQKIDLRPESIDTVLPVTPMTYMMLPVKADVPARVDSIEAAKLNIQLAQQKLYKGFVKAGFGIYTTPLFELYYDQTRSRKNAYGLHYRHLSSNGGIERRGSQRLQLQQRRRLLQRLSAASRGGWHASCTTVDA